MVEQDAAVARLTEGRQRFHRPPGNWVDGPTPSNQTRTVERRSQKLSLCPAATLRQVTELSGLSKSGLTPQPHSPSSRSPPASVNAADASRWRVWARRSKRINSGSARSGSNHGSCAIAGAQ